MRAPGYITGAVETEVGPVPRIATRRTGSDRWGSLRVRLGLGRMRYAVEPGLYAIGEPGPSDPVLATANYKLSFDHVRGSMNGRDAWLLVLDTGGINVWCAAGKGTFGTREVVRRIEAARLADVVSHRRIVLPQLGAPGVAAHEVKEASGFRVRYGPVRAADLPAWLDAGMKASPAMRRKTFPVGERLALVPMELFPALKLFLAVAVAFLLLGGLGGPGSYFENVRGSAGLTLAALCAALLAGSVATPLLLPLLPGRAFSVKGVLPALAGSAAAILLAGGTAVEAAAWLLMGVALTTFLALNFTGASTYTSLSGVKLELRRALPLQAVAGAMGFLLWLGARISA